MSAMMGEIFFMPFPFVVVQQRTLKPSVNGRSALTCVVFLAIG